VAAGSGPDQLAKQLAGLWADLLDVALVEPDEDFFSLGGNSLLALRLVNRVRAELGVDLPFGQVFEAPTVRAMASCVRRGGGGASCAVTLSAGSGPELFLFHPVGGSVAGYPPLARAWNGSVRAFQSRALADRSAVAVSADLVTMAAGYRAELQRLAAPPYLLGGWSMGGVLAYEVARQLAELGQPAYPFMIDSDLRQSPPPATDQARHLEFLSDLAGGRLPAGIATALAAAQPEALAPTGLAAAVEHRLLPAEVEVAEYQRLVAVHAANLAALADYRPGRFDGPALLFVADQVDRPDPVAAWRAVSPGLTAQVWSADHHSIVTSSRLAEIASAVQEWLAGNGLEPTSAAEKEEIR